MPIPLNLVWSSGIWDVIPKIASPLNLAAFALAIVLYMVIKTRQKSVPLAAWIVIVLLVAVPVGAWIYSQFLNKSTIYRVRVIVVDPQGIPLEDAKVWSSFGGEPKKVMGGWQFDIPDGSKPKDSKLSIFAAKESAFLTGRADLSISDDYNLAVTINLARDDSAKVRGQVVDEKNRAIAGARVFVVGYESEAVITKEGGNFEMPAHAAVNQQVLLHAEKSGYRATKRGHPAGDTPAELVLER